MHKINAAKPRLSDEEIDPLEADDLLPSNSHQLSEGWFPWTHDDVNDIKHMIQTRLCQKQKEVVLAFLAGENHHDIGVTEKFYRYHLLKAIKFMQQELKL